MGTPKAGSSAVQNFLRANRKELGSLSVDYPHIGRGDRISHHNFVDELRHNRKFKPELGSLYNLRDAYFNNLYNISIISAEMFETLNKNEIGLLASTLQTAGREFIIVFILRDLVDLLPSSYAQKVRFGSHTYDFDTFFDWRLSNDRTDYFKTASRWAKVFGWERLHVRTLSSDDMVNGDLIDEFLTIVGLDPDDAAIRSLSRPGIVNASIDWRVREALRTVYGDRNHLGSGHPLTRYLDTGKRERKTLVEPVAEKVGVEFGWEKSKGHYLTRVQAERVLSIYHEQVVALNANLHKKLPLPTSLEKRGFVAREFPPEAASLPASTLNRFFDRLTSALAAEKQLPHAQKKELREAKSSGGPAHR